MGEMLDRTLAKWDARNQATMENHNEIAGGSWEEFADRNFPGPRWAYVVSGLPVIGWFGAAVVARAYWKRRRGRS